MDYEKSSTREILIRVDERVKNLNEKIEEKSAIADKRLDAHAFELKNISNDVSKAKGWAAAFGAITGFVASWFKH